MRRPKNYWTKERCQIEALKYTTRKEMYESSYSAYQKSTNSGWLDEICSHMGTIKRNRKGYWTKERCQIEALKYSSRTLLKIENSAAYNSAQKNKWLDEICSHMVELIKPDGYWTKERCQKDAMRYQSRTEFYEKSTSSYRISIKNKWLDEICSHMIESQKPKNYWNKERCQEEALKYQNRRDFRIFSRVVYEKSQKHKWLDEICSHMIDMKNNTLRCIYGFIFENNHVYIGLTNDFNKRTKKHLKDKNSQVYIYNKNNKNIKYTITQLTEYMDVDTAKNMEEYYVQKYKNKKFTILNIAKTGSIGSPILYWTKDKCKKQAQLYHYRKEFQLNDCSAYNSARKNKWLDEICSHMKNGRIK